LDHYPILVDLEWKVSESNIIKYTTKINREKLKDSKVQYELLNRDYRSLRESRDDTNENYEVLE
jgi:hypothetical protein